MLCGWNRIEEPVREKFSSGIYNKIRKNSEEEEYIPTPDREGGLPAERLPEDERMEGSFGVG